MCVCALLTCTGGKVAMKLAVGCAVGGLGVMPMTGAAGVGIAMEMAGAAVGMAMEAAGVGFCIAMETGGWAMIGCWCCGMTAGIAMARPGRLGTGGEGNWFRMSGLITGRPLWRKSVRKREK